jgi:3-hydroxyisobutyrate dehydrogenase
MIDEAINAQNIVFILNDSEGAKLANLLAASGRQVLAYIPANTNPVPKINVARTDDLVKSLQTADAVLTLLTNASQLEDIYLERKGILQNAHEGCCIINLTFCQPRFSRELHALASVHDCYFADAPIASDVTKTSGFSDRVYLGCESNISSLATALLHDAGLKAVFCGLPGSGSGARLSALISEAAILLGLAEAFACSSSYKLNREANWDILVNNPLRSESEKTLAKMILEENFSHGYPLTRFYQDITIALDAAEDLQLSMPVIETTHQLCDLLMMIGASEMGVQALALVFAEEDYCKKLGLDWDLAQRFMDVYDPEGDDFDEYDDDDDGFDDFDDGINRRFSAN